MKILFENLNPKQTVLKNTFWLYFSNFFSKIFKLLIIITSAKYLGPQGYGHFSYVLAIVGSFFIFADWGSGYLTVRDYQKEENKKELIENFITFRLIILALTSLLIFLGFLIFKDYQSRLMFLIIFIFSLISQVKYMLHTIFQALKRMEYEGISTLIESFLILILVIFFLREINKPIFLSVAYLIGITISFFYALLIFKKLINLENFKFQLNRAKYFLINGTPIMFFGVLGFIFFTTDQIILGYLKGYQEVGYYTLVTKLILNLHLIIGFFLAALFPHLSEMREDVGKIRRIINKVVVYNFLIYFSICLLSLILIEPIFTLFFSNGHYEPSINLFKFLVWMILLISFISILDHLLFIYNKQWQNFFITAFCASLNLLLNFLLIPYYGMYGAAITTYIAQLLNLLLSYYLVRKYIFKL